MKRILLSLAAAALLGATPAPAPLNSAYDEFTGTWNCQPFGDAWEAQLVVTALPNGSIEFTQTPTGIYSAGSAHFYMKYDPKSETWSKTDPQLPYDLTGKQTGTEILLAGPEPERLRFQVDFSPSGRVFDYLTFHGDTPRIEHAYLPAWRNQVTQCKRVETTQ